jgi:hypothetical protein
MPVPDVVLVHAIAEIDFTAPAPGTEVHEANIEVLELDPHRFQARRPSTDLLQQAGGSGPHRASLLLQVVPVRAHLPVQLRGGALLFIQPPLQGLELLQDRTYLRQERTGFRQREIAWHCLFSLP